MRLHLRLSPSTGPVPFDHLPNLTGVLHKWLGEENAEHDGLSLYSFGWLSGARPRSGALHFPAGAGWRISFADPAAAARARRGILGDPLAIFGMRVIEVQSLRPPALGTAARFFVDGPVLTRQTRDDGGRDHLTFRDPAAGRTLTRTFLSKLAALGIDPSDARVEFDQSFEKARTKMVNVRGVEYRTSECPVIVRGTPEAVQAAWLVGVGELTGMGLGALR